MQGETEKRAAALSTLAQTELGVTLQRHALDGRRVGLLLRSLSLLTGPPLDVPHVSCTDARMRAKALSLSLSLARSLPPTHA